MAVIEAQPGIIPVVEAEIDAFEQEAEAFQRGERGEEFRGFRLRQGVYGQRQPDAQMFRVKIPGGILNARQLDALGDLAERFAPLGKGHITTRENVQFHHLELEQAAPAMRLLGNVGLTSREACGNTVRNVITCPLAGICQSELFDVTPYLAAYVRYFVRQPLTQNLPRKVKTSFSPCANDCAVAPYHDLGFVAAIRTIDGLPRRGFRVYVGGGSSVMPRAAQPLYEFVPVEDYLRVSEAVLRVFNRSDELRKNRMKARIKYLIERIGLDAFRELVDQELQQPWAQRPIDPTPYLLSDYEPAPPSTNGHADANGHAGYTGASGLLQPLEPKLLRWLRTNVVRQRQPGYVAAYVTVPFGDLNAQQFHGLADIARSFGNGQARTTWEQNLLLRWVPASKTQDLWAALDRLGLGEPGAQEIEDVVSCPGTDSCKLGITCSMGLGRAIRRTLLQAEIEDPLVRQLHIKISGCPNGCGRHHLANIGFQGASTKGADGRPVPAYELYIGGEYEGASFRYAERVADKIPAKRVPEAVERIIAFYQAERHDGERFNDFAARVGLPAFARLVADLRPVGPLGSETLEYYLDWERTILYKVERGEGECSA